MAFDPSKPYQAALTHQLKWNTGKNKYNDKRDRSGQVMRDAAGVPIPGNKPMAYSLFIPRESMLELAMWLQQKHASTTDWKQSSVRKYDPTTRQGYDEVVEGIYLRGKGGGQDGYLKNPDGTAVVDEAGNQLKDPDENWAAGEIHLPQIEGYAETKGMFTQAEVPPVAAATTGACEMPPPSTEACSMPSAPAVAAASAVAAATADASCPFG